MRLEWLEEAQREYIEIIHWRKLHAGTEAARKFHEKVQKALSPLCHFPDMGACKPESILDQLGFQLLFIDQYACVYRIEGETVFLYHFVDGRTNYIQNLFY